jgi:hypothetical protein
LKTDDIFSSIRQIREAEENFGGFELMKRPGDGYYRGLPERLGDQLTVSLFFGFTGLLDSIGIEMEVPGLQFFLRMTT